MKINKEYKTQTYQYNDIYFVDVVTTAETVEAWLYSKDNGVKMLMFGLPIYQQTYGDAVAIITANVKDYIIGYIEEYED